MELRHWDVPSSSSSKVYRVEETPDSVHGGVYIFCPCPSWPFKKGQGMDCKHVEYVKTTHLGLAPAIPRAPSVMNVPLPTPAPGRISQPVLDKYGLPVGSDASKARILADELATHEQGTCGIRKPHSKADHDAAVAMGVA